MSGEGIARGLVVVCLLAVACGPIPGGKLSGAATPVPSDWSAVVPDTRFCEIEARPADPHSIQLECFLYEGGLYVQSHRWVLASWWPVTSWAAVWIANPDVQVRVSDALYAVRAVRVVDPGERAAVPKHRGYEPPPDGIVVFRFEARASS